MPLRRDRLTSRQVLDRLMEAGHPAESSVAGEAGVVASRRRFLSCFRFACSCGNLARMKRVGSDRPRRRGNVLLAARGHEQFRAA